MKKLMILILLLASGLTLAWNAGSSRADDQETMQFKIGFVNFREVFDKYTKTDEVNEKIRVMQEQLKGQMDDLQRQFKQLDADLATMQKGTDLYNAKDQELYVVKRKIDQLKESGVAQIEEFVLRSFETIYITIRGKVEEYGKSHGYTLILKVDDMDEASIHSDSKFELNEKIHHRPVLFFDQRHDLTQAVIDLLNE